MDRLYICVRNTDVYCSDDDLVLGARHDPSPSAVSQRGRSSMVGGRRRRSEARLVSAGPCGVAISADSRINTLAVEAFWIEVGANLLCYCLLVVFLSTMHLPPRMLSTDPSAAAELLSHLISMHVHLLDF